VEKEKGIERNTLNFVNNLYVNSIHRLLSS